MPDLHRLVYISRAVPNFGDDEVQQILSISRARNQRLGVTGLLLFAGNSFIQALEGSREAVEAVFASIEKDGRHSWVIVLVREPIDRRSFPAWSMGFQRRAAEPAPCESGFELSDSAVLERLSSAALDVKDMLLGFLDMTSKRAGSPNRVLADSRAR